jgi:hypothetical protein
LPRVGVHDSGQDFRGPDALPLIDSMAVRALVQSPEQEELERRYVMTQLPAYRRLTRADECWGWRTQPRIDAPRPVWVKRLI